MSIKPDTSKNQGKRAAELPSSARVTRVIDGQHPIVSILRLLGLHRARVLLGVLFFVIKDTPVWLMPVIIAQVTDIVVNGGPLSSLGFWGIVAVVALVQNYPNNSLFIRFYMGAIRQIGADLRNALAARLQSLSIGFHSRASSSVVQTKVVRDVENIEVMLQQSAQPLLGAIVIITGALVMTAIQVPQFLPVYLLTVPLAVLLRMLLMKRSKERNERFRREVEHFSARVGEMATLMPITRAHGLEDVAVERVHKGAEGVRDAGFSLDVLNGRFSALSWVTLQLLSVGTLLLAALVAITGFWPISAGQVIMLSSFFGLITSSATSVLLLIPLFSRGAESVRSIAEVLQEPDVEFNEGKDKLHSVKGHLALDEVNFAYPGDEGTALSDIDLDIKPGETIAFVGASGAGKSTLLNLVLGFVRPSSGRVLLDGRDMEDLDLRSFRRFVSVVPQESVLFEGSIKANVAYGLDDVSDAQIEQALRDANAWDFVGELPDGWNTVVGERGARISGGQRQRIAIARALVRDPKVLLLDEATSALDPIAEAKVREALSRLMRGRTTLVVAHRLSTIQQADRIVVMERGRIVEVGSHDELLARGGRYTQLHRAQQQL